MKVTTTAENAHQLYVSQLGRLENNLAGAEKVIPAIKSKIAAAETDDAKERGAELLRSTLAGINGAKSRIDAIRRVIAMLGGMEVGAMVELAEDDLQRLCD